MNSIKERLRSVAERFGGPAALARRLGILPQSLNNYLSGRSIPGTKMQFRLRGVGCDIEWLMTGENKTRESVSVDQSVPPADPSRMPFNRAGTRCGFPAPTRTGLPLGGRKDDGSRANSAFYETPLGKELLKARITAVQLARMVGVRKSAVTDFAAGRFDRCGKKNVRLLKKYLVAHGLVKPRTSKPSRCKNCGVFRPSHKNEPITYAGDQILPSRTLENPPELDRYLPQASEIVSRLLKENGLKPYARLFFVPWTLDRFIARAIAELVPDIDEREQQLRERDQRLNEREADLNYYDKIKTENAQQEFRYMQDDLIPGNDPLGGSGTRRQEDPKGGAHGTGPLGGKKNSKENAP